MGNAKNQGVTKQMHRIRHQPRGVEHTMMLLRRFLEFFSGEVLITRVAQDRLASSAELEDMLGVPKEDKAWQTRPWTTPCCKSHTRSFPLVHHRSNESDPLIFCIASGECKDGNTTPKMGSGHAFSSVGPNMRHGLRAAGAAAPSAGTSWRGQ